MFEENKDTILQFLHDHPMTVIATNSLDSTSPESALIAFVELPGFEIVFETFEGTRKQANIANNPHVSLVVGWDTKKHLTLQYEGIAKPISKKSYEKYIQIFLSKDTPCKEEFLRHPHVRLYKIKPTWLRYSDYTGAAPVIIEHRF